MALTRSSRLLGGSAFLLLVGLWGSCTSLEDIELGVCGNGVLDPGEDCDGHEKNGAACAEPGSASACRYLCDFASAEPVCPDAEYRCGADNVCARAADGLTAGADLDIGGDAVVVSDLDGDRVLDIAVANSASRELLVSFLGAGTAVEVQQRVPVDSTTLASGQLTSDERGDVVVASEGSLVSFSSQLADRSLVGNASAFISIDAARLIGVPARAILDLGTATPLEPDTVVGGVLVDDSIYYQNPFSFKPAPAGVIGAPVASDAIVAFFSSRFFPLAPGADACDEVILVRRDTNELTVVPMCKAGAPAAINADCINADVGCHTSIHLDDAPLAAFPIEIDGDPEAEIIVVQGSNAAPTLQIFEGLAGLSEPPPDPLPDPPDVFPVHVEEVAVGAEQDWLAALAAAKAPKDETEILAIAFLNDDADPDFVRSDGVFLSKRDDTDLETPLAYFEAAKPSEADGDWSEAVIGDFGGDARPDVLASYGRVGADLDLLIGNDLSYMNPLAIGTNGAASRLSVGDFDGDGRSDVVLRERPTNDDASAPSCDVVDSLVVRFGAEGPAALGDARVLARSSGVELLVPGSLPRFDTNDSVTDFAAATRCTDADGAVAPLDITLFYGAVNRQVVAPKVLIDNLDHTEAPQEVVPYTPKTITAFPAMAVIAALGENRFEYRDGAEPADFALFVLESDGGEPLAKQHIALMGEPEHVGLEADDFRLAVADVGGDQPIVVVADPKHLHLIPSWADLPDASDRDPGSALDAFQTLPIDGADGALVVTVALAGDLTGDGKDDLVIGGSLDGRPFLRVHSDLAASPESYDEIPIEGEAATAVLGAALLPRYDVPVAEGEKQPVDLVVAVSGVGALVVRHRDDFAVLETLPFAGITTVGTGDVDGDQFADVVLVSEERVRVFVRSQRFAGDEPTTTEAGAQ